MVPKTCKHHRYMLPTTCKKPFATCSPARVSNNRCDPHRCKGITPCLGPLFINTAAWTHRRGKTMWRPPWLHTCGVLSHLQNQNSTREHSLTWPYAREATFLTLSPHNRYIISSTCQKPFATCSPPRVAPKNAVMAYTFCETFLLLVSFNTFFGVNNQLAGYIWWSESCTTRRGG